MKCFQCTSKVRGVVSCEGRHSHKDIGVLSRVWADIRRGTLGYCLLCGQTFSEGMNIWVLFLVRADILRGCEHRGVVSCEGGHSQRDIGVLSEGGHSQRDIGVLSLVSVDILRGI